MNATKDILMVIYGASIDFVEYLTPNKGIEDNCVVHTRLRCKRACSPCDQMTQINDSQEDRQLVHALADDVLPHNIADKTLGSSMRRLL